MVARRWVTMNVVRPFISSLIVSMIAASVVGSSAEVGSSSRRIGAFFKKCPGDADALTLANAEMAAALTDLALELVRHRHDELIGLRTFRRFDDLLFGRPGTAVGDVLTNGC